MPAVTQFPALGTTALVAVADGARAEAAEAETRRVVGEFDLACSRFRQDSELTAVNAGAGRPVAVGPLLLEAVTAALRAARLTGGDVDPTVGQALIALGYDRDFTELTRTSPEETPTPDWRTVSAGAQGSPDEIRAVPGWWTVKVDLEAGTIGVPHRVKLDLGATAKALAADHAAAAACAAAGCGVLVSLGGDIAIMGEAPGAGWDIRVTDDHGAGPDAPGQWIKLTGGGLATSSITVRHWRGPAGEAHHLLDPRTGRPVETPWRSVSVAAGSCLDANTASTAAIIRGQRAPAWLCSLGLPSRLVSRDGTARHLAGWPASGDDAPSGTSPPSSTNSPSGASSRSGDDAP